MTGMRKLICILALIPLAACSQKNRGTGITLLDKGAFEAVVDGKQASLYTLTSASGITMQVTNYGGRVVSLWTPDRTGRYEDIVIGCDSLRKYIETPASRFFGPVVGRYANRIAKGEFALDGKTYRIPVNSTGQALHGGPKGFDRVVWDVDSVSESRIAMHYLSPDGEEGFPGNLHVRMVYELTPEGDFRIDYTASTDAPTVVNLSHHGLFNLRGQGNGTVNTHVLGVNASHYLPVDENMIPDGLIAVVKNTPFDFRTPTPIGKRLGTPDMQFEIAKGYDHNWVLDRNSVDPIQLAAVVWEPSNGRCMEVWTDQPGIQFYGGNFLNGKTKGKYGKPIKYREALALETQKFPDSPNRPKFPSTRLDPGETYRHACIYRFYAREE